MFYLFNNKSTSWSVTLTSTASKAFLSSVLSTHPDQQTISPMTPLPLHKYLLLTQFKVSTLSYRASFSQYDL